MDTDYIAIITIAINEEMDYQQPRLLAITIRFND